MSQVKTGLGVRTEANISRYNNIFCCVWNASQTNLGTHKTFSLQHAGTVCVVFGVVTGVAGGMIRDVLLGEVPLVFRPNIYLYATAALIGAIAYLAAASLWPNSPFNLITGATVILLLRLAAIRWRWRLPVFQAEHDGVA